MDDSLHLALMDLMAALNSPRADQFMLEQAGLRLDRALFPLLVRIGLHGRLGVNELAEQVGRDHSTVSRQISKLETAGLVHRMPDTDDRRFTMALLTADGRSVVDRLTRTRRDVFDRVLANWSKRDRQKVAELVRALATDMMRVAYEDQYGRA